MSGYILRRVGQSLFVVFVMATLVFFALYAVGNPVDVLAAPDAPLSEIAEISRRFGLDRPIYEQYWLFLGNALQGDLGKSFIFNSSAVGLILEKLPATLELALLALLLSLVIGIPLGMFAGLRPQSWFSRGIMSGSILGFSLPNFWVALMLILLFSVHLKLLPASGRGPTQEVFGVPLSLTSWEGVKFLILPAITLALYKISLVIRITESGTRDVIVQDYMRFARAKGLSKTRIIGVHLFKNILIPIVTVVGLEFGSMIAFAVVTESVFAYPGIGKLLIDSINRLDRPVIVAYLMMTALIFATINLIVDLLYAAIDPRVRLQG